MADDLGYGDLGAYGQTVLHTPRLDQMAAEGLRFTQFYSGHTVCAPARSTLITGQHTGQTRIRGNFSKQTGERVPLEAQDTTVAEVLQQAGYTTGLVGKWGLGEPETNGTPNQQGFGYFWGLLNQRRAHSHYPEWVWRNTDRVILEGNQNGNREDHIHELYIDEAREFIKDNFGSPFFLYLALQIPHAELKAPDGSLESYLTEDGKSIFNDNPYPEDAHPRYAGTEMPNAMYAAMVTRMDRDIGLLLDLLEELDIDENTIVFFTSDNGPHSEGGYDPGFFDSNGPLRGIKRDLYEGGIRVPMIAWMPGTVPAGDISDQVWSMWDFMPTATDLAGAEIPLQTTGLSMVDALLNRKQVEREYMYWEFHEGVFAQAVRFGDWKAVRNDAGEPVELYNLSEDIGEQHDLSEEYPEQVNQAEELFRKVRNESEHWPVEIDAEKKK